MKTSGGGHTLEFSLVNQWVQDELCPTFSFYV
jgi:hypothetical protein